MKVQVLVDLMLIVAQFWLHLTNSLQILLKEWMRLKTTQQIH